MLESLFNKAAGLQLFSCEYFVGPSPLVGPWGTTRCHSLHHLLSFVVTRCHSMYTRLYKQSHSRWRKLTQRNSHWTGKLQLTLLFSYTFWEKLCSHTFKASLKEVMVIPSDKMKAKYMKEDVWKSFFLLASWHLAIAVQINFFTEILKKWTPSNCYLLVLCLNILNIIWLYLLVKIQQLVHEISSFLELLYKKRCSEKLLKIHK